MIGCTLANTGSRNLAIGPLVLLSQACRAVGLYLISGVQSYADPHGKDCTAGLADGAAGTVEAAGHDITPSRRRRICPLCNENSFAVGHGHADRIGACRCTCSEVLP